jgi:hypothetical protein
MAISWQKAKATLLEQQRLQRTFKRCQRFFGGLPPDLGKSEAPDAEPDIVEVSTLFLETLCLGFLISRFERV